MLSDGECDEGSNWEAILFSAHHKLDNLVAIIDYNKVQKIKGMNVSIVTTARTDEEAQHLLAGMGMPFRKGTA